jgi:hypothetical protein
VEGKSEGNKLAIYPVGGAADGFSDTVERVEWQVDGVASAITFTGCFINFSLERRLRTMVEREKDNI